MNELQPSIMDPMLPSDRKPTVLRLEPRLNRRPGTDPGHIEGRRLAACRRDGGSVENGCALAGRTGSLRQTVTTQPPVRPGERASSGDSRVNDTRS